MSSVIEKRRIKDPVLFIFQEMYLWFMGPAHSVPKKYGTALTPDLLNLNNSFNIWSWYED